MLPLAKTHLKLAKSYKRLTGGFFQFSIIKRLILAFFMAVIVGDIFSSPDSLGMTFISALITFIIFVNINKLGEALFRTINKTKIANVNMQRYEIYQKIEPLGFDRTSFTPKILKSAIKKVENLEADNIELAILLAVNDANKNSELFDLFVELTGADAVKVRIKN